jgi:phosphoribosylformimino-5-aminoimidazole carboxamide ribotide isomerase
MKFRPCIDIHQGKVKQIVGGSLSDKADQVVQNFVASEDAAYFANRYKEDGLTGGHVIKLGPGNETEALKALTAYPGGMQLGGGINPKNAGEYLDKGASHVIVTSYVFKDGEIHEAHLNELMKAVGRERLVLDLSCRKQQGRYYVVTDRWQKFTNYELNPAHLDWLSGFCAEFLIHAADVEGLCKGIQTEVVELLGSWANSSEKAIPMTYAGGIHSMDDIQLINDLGQGNLDFTVGSALDIFGGQLLKYDDMLTWR